MQAQEANISTNLESLVQNVINKPEPDEDDEMHFDEIELGLLQLEEFEGDVGTFLQNTEVPPTSQDPEAWKRCLQKQNAVAQTNAAVFKQVCGIRGSFKDALSRVGKAAGKDGKFLVKRPKLFSKASLANEFPNPISVAHLLFFFRISNG